MGQIVFHNLTLMHDNQTIRMGDDLFKVMKASKITIKINPAEREIVEDAMRDWKLNGNSTVSVEFEEDSKIERGGCKVESDLGGVDATLQTQLAQFEKFINEVYENVKKTRG